jgi:hypothetical protein
MAAQPVYRTPARDGDVPMPAAEMPRVIEVPRVLQPAAEVARVVEVARTPQRAAEVARVVEMPAAEMPRAPQPVAEVPRVLQPAAEMPRVIEVPRVLQPAAEVARVVEVARTPQRAAEVARELELPHEIEFHGRMYGHFDLTPPRARPADAVVQTPGTADLREAQAARREFDAFWAAAVGHREVEIPAPAPAPAAPDAPAPAPAPIEIIDVDGPENRNPNNGLGTRGNMQNRYNRRYDHLSGYMLNHPCVQNFREVEVDIIDKAPLSLRGMNPVWDSVGPGSINPYGRTTAPNVLRQLMNAHEYTVNQHLYNEQFCGISAEALGNPTLLAEELNTGLYSADEIERERGRGRRQSMITANAKRLHLHQAVVSQRAFAADERRRLMADTRVVLGESNRRGRVLQPPPENSSVCALCQYPVASALWVSYTACGHAVHVNCALSGLRSIVRDNQHPDREPTKVTEDTRPRVLQGCGCCHDVPFLGFNLVELNLDDERWRLPGYVEGDANLDLQIAFARRRIKENNPDLSHAQIKNEYLRSLELRVQGKHWDHSTQSWVEHNPQGCGCFYNAHPRPREGGVNTEYLDRHFAGGQRRRNRRTDEEGDAGDMPRAEDDWIFEEDEQ